MPFNRKCWFPPLIILFCTTNSACTAGLIKIAAHRRGAGPVEKMITLGPLTIDGYKGEVLFEYGEDHSTWRVDFVFTKPAKNPLIAGERIQIWMLARGNKTVPFARDYAPRTGPLVEAGNLLRDVSVDACFFFSRSVPRRDLVAVVIAVDGEPTLFKIPREMPRN